MAAKMRIARKGDLDSLLGLMEKYYAYDGHRFDGAAAKKAMRRLLADRNLGAVLLISEGMTAIGYLVLAFGYSLEFHGRDAFIDEFFLLEEYRGKGVGRTALLHAEKIARKCGIVALHLEVTRHNSRVVDFYGREGFVDHDRYLMTKRLKKSN
jgi:GNAT superfamily N-acetyltransferase